LFYLNNVGNFHKFKKNLTTFFTIGSLAGLVSFTGNLIIFSEVEWAMPFEMFPDYLWEDWYEALNNGVMNDGVGLMISYYLVNSFEFLLLGFLLLIGSLVLVNLNKLNKDIQHPLYNSAIEVFQFIQT
jgi:hypothetical protein